MITIALFVYEKLIIDKTPPREIICRNYRHYDPVAFNNDLNSLYLSLLYSCSKVNDISNILEQNLVRTMDNHATKMKNIITGRRCPWLLTEKPKMNKILKKARTTRKDTEWSNYKQLKNRCNNMIKHAKQKYRNNLIANNSKNPKTFWKAVKEVSPTKNITSSSFTPSSIPEKISKANNFQFIFFICP